MEVVRAEKLVDQFGVEPGLIAGRLVRRHARRGDLDHLVGVGAVEIGDGIAVGLAVDDHAMRGRHEAVIGHPAQDIADIDQERARHQRR